MQSMTSPGANCRRSDEEKSVMRTDESVGVLVEDLEDVADLGVVQTVDLALVVAEERPADEPELVEVEAGVAVLVERRETGVHVGERARPQPARIDARFCHPRSPDEGSTRFVVPPRDRHRKPKNLPACARLFSFCGVGKNGDRAKTRLECGKKGAIQLVRVAAILLAISGVRRSNCKQ